MEKSWLIQRLQKPHTGGLLGGRIKDNPFSFGGGLKNGGLSDGAMDLIRSIWSFDYMGAAEYEWGAVPQALQEIAKAADAGLLTTFVLSVPLGEVPPSWRDKSATVPDGEGTIYVLCHLDHEKEVRNRINGWARGKGPDVRDSPQLTASLRPYDEWDGDKAGWLELDNGFLFFTDEEMWLKTCDLFGVEVRKEVA